MSERVMKIDRNDKSILIRALHAQYRERKAKGKSFAEGSVVTLYYDPDAPEKMFVEGDKSVLGAELLYVGIGVALLVLMVGIMNR